MKRFRRICPGIAFVASVLLSLAVACQSYSTDVTDAMAVAKPTASQATAPTSQPHNIADAQLVDIRSIDLEIRLDLRYATANNFTHKKLYQQSRCLLRAITAAQLAQVQTDLKAIGLGLKVYDCYRPLSVQKQMWRLRPNDRFVANPATGSRHNRGSAVDVTLVDRAGKELTMPTAFDDFTEQAASNYDGASTQAKQNRQRLQDAMMKRGFKPLSSEWWHFDAADWAQFPVLDVPLEAAL